MLLLSASALAQVQVTVRASKPVYLAGEPIYAIVHVVNVGLDPVAYSDCDSRVTLEVVNQAVQATRSLWGCRHGMAAGTGCGVDHPPRLQPGQSTDFHYLLRNYKFRAGRYMLRVSGKAGVRWKFSYDYKPSVADTPKPSKFHNGDVVPGERFEQIVAITIVPGSARELRAVWVPYVEAAFSTDPGASYRARDAMSEMAPPFLEKQIREFAENPNTTGFAVKGLRQIHTQASRKDLIDIFDESADVQIRAAAVYAVAEMYSSEELPFFRSFLSGRNADNDDSVREPAVLAIGWMGGAAGVKQLASFLKQPNHPISQRLRSTTVLAMAAGRSKAAIPTLIELYRHGDAMLQNDVCGALISLTHRNWCVRAPDQPDIQAPWSSWWNRNSATTKLYGLDDCVEFSEAKPLW